MTPEVGFEVTARHVRLALHGDQDLDAVVALADELTAARQLGRPLVLIDLDAVTLLSAAAMHALLRAERDIAVQRGRLAIVCRRPEILRILRLARLDRRLTVYDSLADALVQASVQGEAAPTAHVSPRPRATSWMAG